MGAALTEYFIRNQNAVSIQAGCYVYLCGILIGLISSAESKGACRDRNWWERESLYILEWGVTVSKKLKICRDYKICHVGKSWINLMHILQKLFAWYLTCGADFQSAVCQCLLQKVRGFVFPDFPRWVQCGRRNPQANLTVANFASDYLWVKSSSPYYLTNPLATLPWSPACLCTPGPSTYDHWSQLLATHHRWRLRLRKQAGNQGRVAIGAPGD